MTTVQFDVAQTGLTLPASHVQGPPSYEQHTQQQTRNNQNNHVNFDLPKMDTV